MKRLFALVSIIVTMGFTVACAQSPKDKKTIDSPKIEDISISEEEQLRLDVGEMLLVGFRGTEINDDHHIVRDILKYNIGGVILFEYDAATGKHNRNITSPEQLKKLCSDLQNLKEETLLIGIDQEGGKVCRLKERAGFEHVISAKAMGEGGVDTITKYAKITGKMLRDAGINLNFAPCVDVDINPHCPVIGGLGRSFSADAMTVGKLAEEWIKVSNKYGIISCIKHFPGHGSSDKDSHHGLVDVTNSWDEVELEPYKMLAQKADMVMTTHVINGKIDEEYPATLSQITIDKLHKEIGFQGVVITDDMAMKAITNEYGYEDAIKLSLIAGVDMFCLGNNGGTYHDDIVPKTIDIITQLVENGEVTAEQIHTSAEKIRALKNKINKNK